MSDQTHDAQLTAVEAALVDLAPASHLDRDQLLFRAGQASVRWRAWPWQAAAGVMTMATAALALAWVLRPTPPVIERVVTVVVYQPAPYDPPSSPAAVVGDTAESNKQQAPDYLKIRAQVLRWGVDYLPAASPSLPESSAGQADESWNAPLRAWGRLN
jgi:hypothetical protein